MKRTTSKDALLVSIFEAAQILGVSHWALRKWIERGQVKSTRLGRRLLIPRAEVERLAAEGTK